MISLYNRCPCDLPAIKGIKSMTNSAFANIITNRWHVSNRIHGIALCPPRYKPQFSVFVTEQVAFLAALQSQLCWSVKSTHSNGASIRKRNINEGGCAVSCTHRDRSPPRRLKQTMYYGRAMPFQHVQRCTLKPYNLEFQDLAN